MASESHGHCREARASPECQRIDERLPGDCRVQLSVTAGAEGGRRTAPQAEEAM